MLLLLYPFLRFCESTKYAFITIKLHHPPDLDECYQQQATSAVRGHHRQQFLWFYDKMSKENGRILEIFHVCGERVNLLAQ